MYIRRNIRWRIIFRFGWKKVLVFTLWSLAVVMLYLELQEHEMDCSLPIAPLGTIGIAVAFYIGFKNNQAYDRSWEARKIWGGIVNVSRSFANQVISFISVTHSDKPVSDQAIKDLHRDLIYRHLAWITTLRFQLRRKTSSGSGLTTPPRPYMQLTSIDAMKSEVSKFLSDDETEAVGSYANAATQILRNQSETLRKAIEDQKLTEEFRYIAIHEQITEMYSLQGKCERIKNTPFPRQYAYFSGVFTWIFVLLLPFGLVGELATRGPHMIWWAVPLSVVSCWIFFTMETVGDASEDPFENYFNDIPMTALCRTIEIDLRQMLGEQDLPESIEPVHDVLM